MGIIREPRDALEFAHRERLGKPQPDVLTSSRALKTLCFAKERQGDSGIRLLKAPPEVLEPGARAIDSNILRTLPPTSMGDAAQTAYPSWPGLFSESSRGET